MLQAKLCVSSIFKLIIITELRPSRLRCKSGHSSVAVCTAEFGTADHMLKAPKYTSLHACMQYTYCGFRHIYILLHLLVLYVGVLRGKGKIPVAEYTLAAQVMERISEPSRRVTQEGDFYRDTHLDDVMALSSESPGIVKIGGLSPIQIPLKAQPSGSNNDCETGTQRGVYSFCMCPGGQVR